MMRTLGPVREARLDRLSGFGKHEESEKWMTVCSMSGLLVYSRF